MAKRKDPTPPFAPGPIQHSMSGNSMMTYPNASFQAAEQKSAQAYEAKRNPVAKVAEFTNNATPIIPMITKKAAVENTANMATERWVSQEPKPSV